ncbi:hypothetical protein GZH53_11580 [Flavihumibacter sp. R14]|nr:hypothetical protein [Flavihumibacter soli]
MSWIPITISLVSLSLTLITLYLTQLRPAKINVIIGPEIQIYHADYPDISTGLYVPVTFANFSPNMGVIIKCAISVFRNDTPQQRHFILWREFAKKGDDGWTYDSEAHSFAIGGKSSVSKVAWFMWFTGYKPMLLFKEGSYKLSMHVWIGNKKLPINFKRSFFITKERESILQSRIDSQSRTGLRIILDEELDRNKLLTDQESRKLLNDLPA